MGHDMAKLRLSPHQQQTYRGFNVPQHLQAQLELPPRTPLDEAYRSIFMRDLNTREKQAEVERTAPLTVGRVGKNVLTKWMTSLSGVSARGGPDGAATGALVCVSLICALLMLAWVDYVATTVADA